MQPSHFMFMYTPLIGTMTVIGRTVLTIAATRLALADQSAPRDLAVGTPADGHHGDITMIVITQTITTLTKNTDGGIQIMSTREAVAIVAVLQERAEDTEMIIQTTQMNMRVIVHHAAREGTVTATTVTIRMMSITAEGETDLGTNHQESLERNPRGMRESPRGGVGNTVLGHDQKTRKIRERRTGKEMGARRGRKIRGTRRRRRRRDTTKLTRAPQKMDLGVKVPRVHQNSLPMF